MSLRPSGALSPSTLEACYFIPQHRQQILRCLCTKASSSRASSAGDIEDLPFAGHIAHNVPAGLGQAGGVLPAVHDQVNPDPHAIKLLLVATPVVELAVGLDTDASIEN